MDFRELRREFPISSRTPPLVYLNHAGVSPLARPVVAAMASHLRDISENGASHFSRWLQGIETTRGLAARLVAAHPDEIAFVANTTDGMAIAAAGLPFERGDNVVLSNCGYPAAVLPFRALEARGVETRWVDDPGGRILPAAVLERCDEKTRAVALSLVEYTTGFRLDVETLGPLLSARGIRFVVDAIQGLGVTPLDARAAAIDVLSCGGFKWLLGPMGTGFVYVRRELLDEIRWPSVGAGSVLRPFDFTNLSQPLAPSARRFEGGTLNITGIAGLGAALAILLDRVGIETVRSRVLALLDRAQAAIRSRGYTVRSPVASEAERSGILAFSHPEIGAAEIERSAAARGVVMVTRRGWSRIAPHAWNDESDIDALLAAIP
jgi:selenocysteine lyase/cysteine desulfurase